MHSASKKRLFLIDGYSYLFRAYHSLPPLTTPDGTPAGAIYGVCNMFLKLKNKVATSNTEQAYMLLVLDSGKETFRNEIYSDYKANRPDPPEDLVPQFGLLREVADALNIHLAELKGYEADDIIATYTKRASEENYDVTIVSTDKDLMQLVDDEQVEMYDPMRDRIIGIKQVEEKFGVGPEKVLDVLSLMGDSIDNIPGVPGIGPKTAAELLGQYGTLENLLEKAEEIPQKKRRENLIEFKEQALMSKKLAALEFDCPLDHKLEEFQFKEFEQEKLAKFLNRMGFKSILAKIGAKVEPVKHNNNFGGENKSAQNNGGDGKQIDAVSISKFDGKFTKINNEHSLNKAVENLLKADCNEIAIQIDVDEKAKSWNFISLCDEFNCYIVDRNLDDKPDDNEDAEPKATEPQNDLFSNETSQEKADNKQVIFKNLAKLFEAKHKKFIFTSAKQFSEISNTPLPAYFDDVEILNYLTQTAAKKGFLETLILEFFSDNLDSEEDSSVEFKQAKIAFYLLQISGILKEKLFELKLNNIYEHFDKPMVGLLLDMQENGIKVDSKILKQLSDEFKLELNRLAEEIYKLAGEEFNIGSPKQLGEVLFDKMGIQGAKKSKSGAYVTDSDKMESLAAQGHEIAEKVLEWRGFSKLISTYTEALQKAVDAKTGRVHTHFNHTSTTTGRLSSSDPNLQNIPIRTENGRKIRKAFIAEKGNKLIGIDYSQIELRLLAHVADIDILKQAFKEGKDIHSATAAQVFGVSLEDVTAELRRRAKTVNFGIIYGQSAFGLAKQLGIANGEAKEIIEKYFAQYPGIKKYMDKTILQAKENEYVETIFGRKIFIKGINNKNGALRQFAERAAINAPLQGSASDIIKAAMVRIAEELGGRKLGLGGVSSPESQSDSRAIQKNIEIDSPRILCKNSGNDKNARLLLQIHDELIIEAPEENAEEIAKRCKKIMENIAFLTVPLVAEANIGNNWGEVH